MIPIWSAGSAPRPSLDAARALQDALGKAARDIRDADPETTLTRLALTGVLIAAALALIWIARRAVTWAAKKLAPPGKEGAIHAPRLGRVTLALAQLFILVWALGTALTVWGVDLRDFAETPIGGALRSATRIAFIVIIATAAIEITEFAVRMAFERWRVRSDTPRRAAQVRTLSPIALYLTRAIIFAVAGATILSSVGVDVGPLIAGAGVVGIAVGFGAQTLVKDLITGFFLIMEDVVSVGDVVRIRDFSGSVEEMTLRTIRLRDFDGTLHIIPFSEAQTISNMTKDFSYYVFDISVAYSTDLNRALQLMHGVGDELREDPQFKDMILAPIEVVGVDKLAESGVTLKARIRTRPIMQWSVGREYLKRIKIAFDKAGVEIPFPHVKLVAPDGDIPIRSDPAPDAPTPP